MIGKIRQFFDIKGGNSGLTEEIIYNNQPIVEKESIKVFSSSTDDKTIMKRISKHAQIDNENIKIFDKEGILISRNGKAGKMKYIEGKKFTMNDHAYFLTVKDNYIDFINLNYILFAFKKEIENCVTSDKEGNRTFNKTLFEQEYINIPDKLEQDKIAKEYIKIRNIYACLESEINYIEKVLNIVPKTDYGNMYNIKDVFNLIPENRLLTEEYIYCHQGEYPVYSAQVNGAYGYIDSFLEGTTDDKEILFVVQYGDSGKTVLRSGKLNIGRNVCGLVPKDKFKNKVNLKYMKYILQAIFINNSKGDGLKSLSQSTIKDTIFFLPDKTEQDKIASEFDKIEKVNEKLQVLKEHIENLFFNI